MRLFARRAFAAAESKISACYGARFKFKFASVNLKGLNCAALDKILNGVGKINGAIKFQTVRALAVAR